MRHSKRKTNITTTFLALALLVGWSASPALAQAPPSYSPEQLDRLVSRIALYPDPLLAQVLAAATFSDQIPDAAKWADEHHYLTGDELAKAISEDHLSWDPSVLALLPFPSVLEMMASDMKWTRDMGDAFLAQHQDVMDAIQRMRQKAKDFGYLRSNDRIVVSGGPYIEILPVDPAFICVPAYDPLVVFSRRGRESSWAPLSVLASVSPLPRHLIRGDGVCAALTGVHTWCSSTTRLGDVSGPTAASMCITTAKCTGGSPHAAWKGTG